jgi:capsular exopolysaccharide synthesis family protein
MEARQSLPPTGEDSVDIREYLAVLRRRFLVIFILTALALGAAIGYSVVQTPTYTAKAEVLVQAPMGFSNTNLRLDQVISLDTEARLVRSAPIAETAKATLGSPLSITQLLKHVSVQTTPETFVLDITYWDQKPSQAALGANAFAKAYLDYKRQHALDEVAQQRESIETQIADLRGQEREQNQILQSSSPGSVDYRNAQDALDRMGVQLAVLASQLADIPSIIDPGEVILPATPPASPSSPKYPLNAAVGLFFGLFLGVVAAFLLDRSDDRVYSRADLQGWIPVPVLASIPHVKGRGRQRSVQLVVDLEPRSPVAEAYRTVRSNVLSMARRRDLKVLAVLSPMQREGKSMTSANLAAALGQTDKRVLVLSADIRKPRIHEYFGVSNEQGLSEVLEGELPLKDSVQASRAGNVWVLPGGRVPERPAELLQSPAMADVVEEVRRRFDFVILDCPPLLGLADCLAVLPLVDAVLLVVQAGQTRGGAILETRDLLERVGASVDAAILNDVRVSRGRPGHHGYGYYLTSTAYTRPEEAEQRRAPRLVTRQEPREPAAGGWDTGNGKAAGDTLPEPITGTAEEP